MLDPSQPFNSKPSISPSKPKKPSQDLSKKEGKIKIKKHDKLTMTRVVMTSPKSIRPSLVSFGNFAAHKVTVGHRSKLFKAKAIHSAFDLSKIWAKHYFQEDLIGDARNIGKKEVLMNKEDFQASIELLESCRVLHENAQLETIFFKYGESPETLMVNGICAGIRMDIAFRILIEGTPLETIIKENEKGASKEAAANQAVYELISHRETANEMLENLLMNLKEVAHAEGGCEITQCDFDLVGKALFEMDPELWGNDIFADFSAKYQPSDSNVGHLALIIRKVMEREIDELQSTSSQDSWLRQRERGRWEIIDPLKCKEAILNEIMRDFDKQLKSNKNLKKLNLQKEQNIRALNWTVALLQYRQGISQALASRDPPPKDPVEKLHQVISDPLIRDIIKSINVDRWDVIREQAVAMARGLKLTSVNDAMGHYSQYPTDAAYLSNLPKLDPGMYSVDIETGKGGHSVSYIKISDDEGYLLDPNGYQVRCRDSEHTILQFQKLFALYKDAANKTVLHEKGEQCHKIRIKKFEPISN